MLSILIFKQFGIFERYIVLKRLEEKDRWSFNKPRSYNS